MEPIETGHQYNKIALSWDESVRLSIYGVSHLQRAIKLCSQKKEALDVGCGTGGRIIALLLNEGFNLTGIDISKSMLKRAKKHHPTASFINADICKWQTQQQYNFIVAWDSLFHIPYSKQAKVLEKLCNILLDGGVILFTVGGIDGEITGQMYNQKFYYSSLAETEYLQILNQNKCKCILMERDQYPENHVIFIAIKTQKNSK